ncbi:MAG: cytochrome d ubiquinol oxidase subunit II [Alphaproteobacteria bacterium]
MMQELPLIWAGIIAFGVLAYVVLDGFDLGIGMLFPFLRTKPQRDRAMSSVAPVWDGNETWLVLGGAGLYGAFPLAFSILLSALYVPMVAMLIGLILRGVAFEFRGRTERLRFVWDWSFAGGSALAAFAQGIALGALVQGIPVEGRAYAGGWYDWFTPFSVFTGAALMTGYGLLGATWLIMKTDGDLQRRAYGLAWLLAPALVAMIGGVSLWTPFLHEHYMARWFAWPAILYTAAVPLLTLLCVVRLGLGLRARRQAEPFLAALGLFVLCYAGLGISLAPYVVPHEVTIAEAASAGLSLHFMLIGTLILLPIILAYTGFAYWVFRGKVRADEGYDH